MNQPKSSPLALTVLSLLSYQPLHPYGIRRLIKQWGKDQVVNVGQPASLYRTIERLLDAGLVAVRETGRDQRYPERTVYEITESGRAVAKAWLAEMVAVPVDEYPQFPAALSFLMLLDPPRVLELLDQRAARLAGQLAAVEASLTQEPELPRVTMLDAEQQRAVIGAELAWVRSVAADLRDGRLSWSAEELAAFAGQDPAQVAGPVDQP
jgi:DNA-binding PadR family transcriptional regulator